jgi:hypothetical protein
MLRNGMDIHGAYSLPSEGRGRTFESSRARQVNTKLGTPITGLPGSQAGIAPAISALLSSVVCRPQPPFWAGLVWRHLKGQSQPAGAAVRHLGFQASLPRSAAGAAGPNGLEQGVEPAPNAAVSNP